MSPNLGGKKEYKKAGELRRSQTITTYGCGAIVDFPRLSGIMAGLDNWNVGLLSNDSKIYERNLELLLGKEFFYQVSTPENESSNAFGLPVIRFPNYYYCPNCHMLDKYSKIRKTFQNDTEYNSDLFCNNCSTGKDRVKLIPSRFIVACLNGHIDDFPFVWWAHRNKGMCNKPILNLEYKGTTGGLDSIHIFCSSCLAEETMAGCMSKDALKGLQCYGKMPWIENNYIDPEVCHAQMRTLQRSANNVYYSVNTSTLTIPPWSNIAQEAINRYHETLEEIFSEEDNEIIHKRLSSFFERKGIQTEYGCMEETFISDAFKTFLTGNDEEEITEKTLHINEYKAFCQHDVDDLTFKTSTEPVPEPFLKLIKQVKLVKRLREVQALQGFRRILPDHELNENVRAELGVFERSFTPISKQPKNWLPAIELFGEGIFIQFNENAINVWEKKNIDRYVKMANRVDQPWIGKGMFSRDSARYVLLHTFAHLLIRQLTSQCGYATASLKEKIYATYPDSLEQMSGILIYTSSTDSDGSLGGLVREGVCNRLENTINALLQEASWCSNDPICVESVSQGYKSLNYAACHACALLPETSCETNNCLLDRAAVIGTQDDKSIAFFKEFL